MSRVIKGIYKMLLSLLMLFSVLPVNVHAEETNDYQFNIFHLDNGRKYFSVSVIEQMIDAASDAGFNYIQLAIGNDGMRFLLDDMTLVVNGETYDSDSVKEAIHAGNETYADFSVDELSESEMDEIIQYSKTKGMEVIPLINSPGHMDAILYAGELLTGQTLSYNGSIRTIDVTNELSTEYTKTFLSKYIEYFKEKGCHYFNFGADEYANDVYTSGAMGFGNLQSTGAYASYITYLNDISKLIKDAGMRPMAFNDGFYFDNVTDQGTIDTDIIIQYWSSGWTSYTPRSASDLEQDGFDLINANGDYYWVLGKTFWQPSVSQVSNFSYTSFQGSTISNPAGSAFLVWCDVPNADTEQSVLENTSPLIEAFGSVLPDVRNTISLQQGNVTGMGLTSVMLEETNTPADLTEYTDALTYSLHAYVEDVVYAGSYEISLEIPEEWNEKKVRGFTMNADGELVQNITGTIINGMYQFACSNAAVVGIYEIDADYTEEQSIHVELNEQFILNLDEIGEVNREALDETIATVEINENTIVFYGVSVGTTSIIIGDIKYNITVSDSALDNALKTDTLSIEYWITNSIVRKSNNTSSDNQVVISSAEASSEEGIEVSSVVDEIGYSNYDGWIEVHYWQSMRLDAENHQTGAGGDDETGNGTTFTSIRFKNAWQYKTTDGNWQYFQENDQIVAYYLRYSEMTDAVITAIKDWGYSTNTTTQDTSGGMGQVALSVSLVMPDQSMSPSFEEVYAKSTTIFNYWNQRNIGIVAPIENEKYKVTKITITDGTRTENTSQNVWYSTDTITWDLTTETEVWNNQMNTTPVANGNSIGTTAIWSAKNTAKLVRIYLESTTEEHEHSYVETSRKEPTCTEDGFITYTCVDGDDSYTEVIPATGHDYYEDPAWTWSQNYSRASAAFTCLNDVSHVIDVDAEVTSEINKGEITYTATVTFEEKTYTDTKTTEYEHDHVYGEWQSDNDSAIYRICEICGEKEVVENPFTDVYNSETINPFFVPILWAYKNNITSGTTKTTFSPNQTVTRAQVVTFLWRAAGSPEPDIKTNPFTDVTDSGYTKAFYKAILWAYENGITTGTTPTTFSPGEGCTRAQIVTFLYRFEGEPSVVTSQNPFTDVRNSGTTAPFYKAVLWAYENGITSGTTPTTFSPNATCTRAQTVTFLYRLMN